MTPFRLSDLFRRPSCWTCRFREDIHSTGDGQVTRWVHLCRCPASPYRDRPLPPEQRCAHWQPAPKEKGQV